MYKWENIFGYVGILQISLVETIFEDKDFDQIFDPDCVNPEKPDRVSIWPRGPIQFIDNPDRANLPYWHTISGGLQTLTDAMYRLVGNQRVKINHRITKVEDLPN